MTTSDESFTSPDRDPRNIAEGLAREQAVEQIERRRRYRINIAMAFFALLIALLAAGFWAMIFYPGIAWVFLPSGLGLGFCPRYLNEPISESQIKRETERQAHLTH